MTLSADEKNRRARAREAGRERDRIAARLKLGGASYQQIADQLGWKAKSSAMRACDRVFSEELSPSDHERLRELEMARLDALLMAWWPRALGNGDATPPDPEAAAIVMRIHSLRVRMLKLDRNPEADMEQELREFARQEGLDEEDVIREAEGIIITNTKRWRSRS